MGLSNPELKTMHFLCRQFTSHQLSAITTMRITIIPKVETITRLDLAAYRLYIIKTTTTIVLEAAVNMLGIYTQTKMMMIRWKNQKRKVKKKSKSHWRSLNSNNKLDR